MTRRACMCGAVDCQRHRRRVLRGGSAEGWTQYKRDHPERAAYYASGAWRSRREAHLRANPDCVVCGQPASHADHVQPVAEGGVDGPLQSMCGEHHRQETLAESHRGMKRAAERRRRGRP